MIKCRPTLLFFNYARHEAPGLYSQRTIEWTPAGPGIDRKMEARKLKLHPIPPELGKRYDQFQKKFRESFARYSLRLSERSR
jgi:hypothetical protein